MKYNFHTHSRYDDGKENLEDYVVSAIDKGLGALGFSGHSPLPLQNHWSLPQAVFPEYVSEVMRLKEKYRDKLPVYLGLEIDYIPGISEDFAGWIKSTPLDYCIGSVHLVRPERDSQEIWFIDGPAEGYLRGVDEIFGGDIRQAVTAFYRQSIEMVSTQPMDIIGHLDKVKMHNKEKLFSTTDHWYQHLVEELLEAIKQKGVIVELNTRGIYTGKSREYFPSPAILQKCLMMEIPVMVNADAHMPQQVDALFGEAAALLGELGFKKMTTPFFETPL